MQRTARRGFSLLELLAAVAIIGILAVLATYGVSKYVFAAKSSEAIHMIGLIKTAQESYKDETFVYLDVSDSLDDLYPTPKSQLAERKKRMWNFGGTEYEKWRPLGVHSDGALLFGYACVAGAAGSAPPQPEFAFDYADQATATKPWYVVQALGDQDADGNLSVFVSNSFENRIHTQNEEE